MKRTIIFCLASLTTVAAHPQDVSTLMGARSAGLGYASATLADDWSLFNNVAGLSKDTQPTAAFAYEARPSTPGSNRAAAILSTPIAHGGWGIGLFSFGDNVYGEQSICSGYANQLGIAALGGSINFVQYRAQGFGVRHAIGLSFGGIVQITPIISVGAYAININQPVISGTDGERLPTRLVTGISFKPINYLLLAIEVEKDLEYAPVIKGGLEYSLNRKISARTGFNLHPNAAFFGFGFISGKIRIDYSLQYSYALSFAYHASASYRLEGNHKKNEK